MGGERRGLGLVVAAETLGSQVRAGGGCREACLPVMPGAGVALKAPRMGRESGERGREWLACGKEPSREDRQL